jgi:transposase
MTELGVIAAGLKLFIGAIIRAKSNRKESRAVKRDSYELRNLIERMFNKLKNWRPVPYEL